MVWVVTSPDFDLRTALQPHAGHLLLIPRLIYWPLLEIFGLEYLPFRILTVFAVCLLVGLLFTWLSRRIPRWAALVPAVVLLYFGTDHLHMLQGNGFTICFSLAMGVLALLLLEREDRQGDLGACAALTVGAATYSVALPFVAGAAVWLLLSRRFRALWVPGVPIALYVVWLLWSKGQDFGGPDSQIQLSSLSQYPRWIFEAAGSSVYSISGLNLTWTSGDTLDLIDLRSAGLAILMIAAVTVCVWKGQASRALWSVLAIALTLWGLQVLVSDQANRLPDDARYLFPGAVVSLLILGAAVQGLRWRRGAFVALYAIGCLGLLTNVILLERNGDFYRAQAVEYKGNAGAVVLASQALMYKAGESKPQVSVDVDNNEIVTQKQGAALLMASVPYGTFAASPAEMLQLPAGQRASLDTALVHGIGVTRSAADRVKTTRCSTHRAGLDGRLSVTIPMGVSIVGSTSGLQDLKIGRFADLPSESLGPLKADAPTKIVVPPDSATDIPWKIGGNGTQLEVCRSD